jgi:Phage integrase, N-terminal SAM-like domain
MFRRTRYQFGWLRRKTRRRGPDVWVWTYRSTLSSGGRKENSVIVGTVLQYPSKTEAWRAAEGLRLAVNGPKPAEEITFGAVIDRYFREAIPKRRTTRSRYQSWIKNFIKPHWRDVPLAKIKPLPVEKWIEGLNLAPKSKGHIRSMMRYLSSGCHKTSDVPQRPAHKTALFGLLPARGQNPERAIRVARTPDKLSKSIVFLSRTQGIFQFWHVMHRPFSYAFAILGAVHIAIAYFMGYRVEWEWIERQLIAELQMR